MTKLPSYGELHRRVLGKVSDKWDLYLEIYNRALIQYRQLPASILEIGVQNGGSLEVWSEFLPKATIIVGCDINPDCGDLVYEDSRINVVVGDATTKETRNAIGRLSPQFDIVIDDGSHRSGDIIKTFLDYFPLVEDNGAYIIEDLHCSYWNEYGGGLSTRYSAIEFLKALIDCINSNHWESKDITASRYLETFAGNGITTVLSEAELLSIASVEFFDSVCIVRKAKSKPERICARIVSGEHSDVDKGPTSPFWTTVNVPEQQPRPLADRQILSQLQLAFSRVAELESSNAQLELELNRMKSELIEASTEKRFVVSQLEQATSVLAELQMRIDTIYASHSWRITAPLRRLKRSLSKIQ